MSPSRKNEKKDFPRAQLCYNEKFMSHKLVRIYKKYDIKEIKEHLFIYGDLSASCANCNKMDLKLDTAHCPECQTEFTYISFRNIKPHMPKVQKLLAERPHLVIVDYDDYKRNIGALKAEEFLK